MIYDGEMLGSCGNGAWPPDLIGQVVALYPNGLWVESFNPPCKNYSLQSDYCTPIFLHEVLHGLGFNSECGQNHANAGHSNDNFFDLMFQDHASEFNELSWDDLSDIFLDPGNDDYFNVDDPNCLDLADSAFLMPLPENPVIPPGWPQLV